MRSKLISSKPSIGHEYVEHYLETYQELLEDAGQPGSNATHDSDALQYFALDAWAYDIAVPGEGCPGEYVEESSSTTAAAAAATTAASSAVAASSTVPETVTGTASIPPGCHTHDGGELHCT